MGSEQLHTSTVLCAKLYLQNQSPMDTVRRVNTQRTALQNGCQPCENQMAARTAFAAGHRFCSPNNPCCLDLRLSLHLRDKLDKATASAAREAAGEEEPTQTEPSSRDHQYLRRVVGYRRETSAPATVCIQTEQTDERRRL